MTHPAPQGRKFKRLASISAATVVLALLAVPAGGAAQAAPPPGNNTIPGVDEIVSSPNLKQLANVPKSAPLLGTNRDWAFQGKYAYGGNYDGFYVYDISNPKAPTVAARVLCPGSQNDISVHGNLLFLGTDSQRTNDSCQNAASTTEVPGERWEGIKIFDISNPLTPQYVKSVKTTCGSHTLTLAPGKGRDKSVYVYISSYNLAGADLPNCALPHDLISVVKVPLKNPTAAAVVATPVVFPDGGHPGGPRPEQRATTGCHDITVYADKDIAAGACMGDGVLFDISNRAAPKVITGVRDTENFAFWHSATFNNRANKVVFTDELGGGVTATCNAETGPNRGANAIYDIVGKGKKAKLVFRSYYKIPRYNADTENCVAHNGSLIPVNGRDVMVQAWYQGGISVFDFTNPAKPTELGWFDRGPLSTERLILGGSWSAYYYNGFIFSNDIQKGLDVLEMRDPRVANGKSAKFPSDYNPQTQPSLR